MIAKRDYALQAFLLVFIVILLQWAADLLMPGPVTGYMRHLRMLTMHAGTILLPAALYIHLFIPGFGAAHRTLTGMEVLLVILLALVGLPALTALNGLLTLLLLALDVPMLFFHTPAITSSGLFAASLLSIAVMPGFAEELLFRGCVMNSLRPYGTRRAILLSALLFAMMHGILQSLPVHFLMGVVLGLLYFYTGSLHAPILYHVLHNALTLLMDLLPAGGESDAGLSIYRENAELLTGTMFGLLMIGILFGGLFVLCLRAVIRRARRSGFVPVKVPPGEAMRFSRGAVAVLGTVLVLLAYMYLNTFVYAMGVG